MVKVEHQENAMGKIKIHVCVVVCES